MDRPHPLLDRLEAGTHSPPPLKSMCLQLLRHAWPAVADVGDAPYELLKDLLPLSTAPQLAQLEDASPQIAPYTNHIWRALAINEFIEVRKVIEDGQLSPEDEPESWRDQYEREEARREAKMEGLLSRMRGQLKEYKEGRKTIERVDAVLLARGRKTPAHSRPKTLMEKARSNTKAITSIYAPGRRKAASTARPVHPVAARPALPSLSHALPSRPTPPLAGFPSYPPEPDLPSGSPDTLPQALGSRASSSQAQAPSSASAHAAFPSYRPRDATGCADARPHKRVRTAGDAVGCSLDGPHPRPKSLALARPVTLSEGDVGTSASTSRQASFSPPASAPAHRSRRGSASSPAGSPPPPRPPPSSHPSQHTQQQPRPRPKPVIKTVTRVVSVPRARPAAKPGSTSTPSSPPPGPAPAAAAAVGKPPPRAQHTPKPAAGRAASPPQAHPPAGAMPPPPPGRTSGLNPRAASPPGKTTAAAVGRTPSARALGGLFIPKRGGGPGAGVERAVRKEGGA